MYDLVIENGKLVDGTGAPARVTSVAIKDGKIAAIGDGLGPARRVIDATGKLVTPGFVDMHTHFDAQVTWDPYLTPSSWHGVTTVVMGNCGVGFAPAAPDKHDWIISLMEGVEDIPGAAMHEGIQWGWETFPEYLDALEKAPRAIDFGAQVPHGPLRAYVMGERGAKNDEATPDDIEKMAAIVKDGLKAGALGFSTSRTLLHKSTDGEFVPGTFASRDELFGIAKVLKEVGHGVFQCASEHTQMPKEFQWMKVVAAEYGRPVIFTLSQTDMKPDLWKEMVGLLEEAATHDIPIFAQSAGRAIGVMMCWRGTAHPFATYPSWQAIKDLPWPEIKAKLMDPDFKAKMLAETPLDMGFFASFVTRSFDKMYLMEGGIEYEPEPSQSIAALAKASGRRPQEIAYDALMEQDAEAMLYFPLFNYANKNLDHLHALHSHPRVKMGLSDAGAHCGAVCDGGMPTFMLTHWTRDRKRGPRLELEHVIKRQTRETAEMYGLMDRGVVAVGYKADLNVIDYENLRFETPKMVFDLPAEGRRLVQDASGYVATIVSGEVIVENGKPTGVLPGKLIRGPQAAPTV
ncbi:MAG TPA: amidohydrolase family protein [Myxococcota bacterium]|nr:amidohydrolase family protein [Myxococcota bacterium]